MMFTIVFTMKLPSYNSLQKLTKLQADDFVVEITLHYLIFVSTVLRSKSWVIYESELQVREGILVFHVLQMFEDIVALMPG